MDGIVKWFSPEKHYGYIQPLVGKPGSVPDLFFHASSVRGGIALPAGAHVSFVVVRGAKGPQAAGVKVYRARLPHNDERTASAVGAVVIEGPAGSERDHD